MACLLLVLLIGLGGRRLRRTAGRPRRPRPDAHRRTVYDFSDLDPVVFMVGVLGTGLTNVILAIALSHWASVRQNGA